MTPTDIWILSMILIINGSVGIGFLLGRPYWFSRGVIDGLNQARQISIGPPDDEEAE